MGALCGAIAIGSGLALYVGIQEVRLHRSGPRRELLAEEIDGRTAGWVQVLGCARHELEVAVSSDGTVVTGLRDARDLLYIPLTSASQCEEDTPAESLQVRALVESADAAHQGLGALYAQGYRAPPTRVIIEGVIGFGVGDGRREHIARRELGQKLPALREVPLLVKDRRPGSKVAAWATAMVGVHGLLLLGLLGVLALRRLRARTQLPLEE